MLGTDARHLRPSTGVEAATVVGMWQSTVAEHATISL